MQQAVRKRGRGCFLAPTLLYHRFDPLAVEKQASSLFFKVSRAFKALISICIQIFFRASCMKRSRRWPFGVAVKKI